MKIKADTLIRDILREHPAAKKVLARYGMRCASCKGAENDSLRRAALNHGIPLPTLLQEIQAALRPGS